MRRSSLFIAACILMGIVESCSKKTLPATTATTVTTVTESNVKTDTVVVVKKDDTLVAAKPVIKRKPTPKTSTPKVITVNDKFASRSVDGRLYYDVEGRRYWRSNKDGKYYLFNKSMLTDEAFKKQN